MKKYLVVPAALVIGAIGLTACGSSQAPATNASVATPPQVQTTPPSADTTTPPSTDTTTPPPSDTTPPPSDTTPPATDTTPPPAKAPSVTGLRLDEAESQLEQAGVSYNEVGGGTFGIIVKSNWGVCQTHSNSNGSVDLIVGHFTCGASSS